MDMDPVLARHLQLLGMTSSTDTLLPHLRKSLVIDEDDEGGDNRNRFSSHDSLPPMTPTPPSPIDPAPPILASESYSIPPESIYDNHTMPDSMVMPCMPQVSGHDSPLSSLPDSPDAFEYDVKYSPEIEERRPATTKRYQTVAIRSYTREELRARRQQKAAEARAQAAVASSNPDPAFGTLLGLKPGNSPYVSPYSTSTRTLAPAHGIAKSSPQASPTETAVTKLTSVTSVSSGSGSSGSGDTTPRAGSTKSSISSGSYSSGSTVKSSRPEPIRANAAVHARLLARAERLAREQAEGAIGANFAQSGSCLGLDKISAAEEKNQNGKKSKKAVVKRSTGNPFKVASQSNKRNASDPNVSRTPSRPNGLSEEEELKELLRIQRKVLGDTEPKVMRLFKNAIIKPFE